MKILFALLAFVTACATATPHKTTPDDPATAPMTHELAAQSTYEIITPGRAQCTGWVADEGYVVTAGHCCSAPGTYMLYNKAGRGIPASLVAVQDTDDDMFDACLLRADGRTGPPLRLATEMPEVGADVGYVGYPLGEYTESQGEYVGDVDGPLSNWNDYVSSAPCDHGASGSAMFTADGVYGILVRLVVVGDQVLPGEYGCVASPLSQIESILAQR